MSSPEIILLVGLPGAGKSTYAESVKDDYVIISTDRYVEDYARENQLTYNEAFDVLCSNRELYSIQSNRLYADLKKAIDENKSIVVDRTNVDIYQRAKILDLIPAHYRKVARIFLLSPEVHLERALKRKRETGKWIPKNVVVGMGDRWQTPTEDEFDEIIWHNGE